MLKAGVITFHEADNFGAVLQCYALQQCLTDLGADTCVVGEKDKNISNFYKIFKRGSNYKETIVSILQLPANAERRRRFNKFRKKYLNIKKEYKDLDLYVCGSDQIWNFQITGGYNPLYFADFERKATSVAVSYAASIGSDNISEQAGGILSDALKGLSLLSVREERAKEILRTVLSEDVSVQVSPDPTLLIDKEQWEALTYDVSENKKYVLIYSLNNCPETYSVAKSISEELGLEVVEILGFAKPYKYAPRHSVVDNIGPLEFLSYVKNAEFVVTDSFHGTVFSTVFKKQFYSVPPEGLGSRMRTLLDKLKLSDRLVGEATVISAKEKIDFDKVGVELAAMQETAKEYLRSAISIAKDMNNEI